MIWILLGSMGVIGLVWFAYMLGFDKGVWQCHNNPGSKRVKEILDETNFWFLY